MAAKGKKLHTFYHACRKDWENGKFRPCQITEDDFVSAEAESMRIQERAVVSNEYEIRAGTEPGGGGESQNHGWLHEWFASPEVREMGYVKLKIRSPYDLQNEIILREHTLSAQCEDQPSDDITFDGSSVDEQCRMQHFFSPRPPVQRELLKLLLPMQSWDAMVAMHVRTGFADFQNAWVRHVMPKVKPSELAEMEEKFPCGTEDIVRGLGQVFEQCKPDYSNQICSHWWEVPEHLQKAFDSKREMRRGPTVEDGIEHCFVCSW